MERYEFDITAAPSTQADIDARLLSARRSVFYWKLSCIQVPLACFAGLMYSLIVLEGLACVLAYLAVSAVGVCWAVWGDVSFENRDAHQPLNRLDCGEMHEFCQETSVTRQYYRAVLAQNRQFVQGEYKAMRKYALDHRDSMRDKTIEENCRRLYQIR